MSGSKTPHQIGVTTTARLHMGFFDLHGGLGRRFGSIGLALSEPVTRLVVARATEFAATGPGGERALAYARQFMQSQGLEGALAVEIESAIPEHSGLGSGTQMAMAAGWALVRLYDLPLKPRDVAAVMQRGMRSGIGIGAFEQGGLLVDGGRAPDTVLPPLLARLDFPEDWRILLMFDNSGTGVHGKQEIEAFRALPEFSAETAAKLCRRVLMQALPAVAERDLAAFGAAIYEIQCCIGDYFASAQGGERFTSATVGGLLEWLHGQGIGCVGQSSWGPTGFAIVENESEAQSLLTALKEKCADLKHMNFMVCRARNQGMAS
ncbi:MAG: GHMP kinase [Methylobacillus sp.]|jgi:beta-RFAP synthase|nr:GHMP kinase [Methylobacillus sp.]